MPTTTLSSKGQVIIPKEVRAAHHWSTGTEFVVEDLGNGILFADALHIDGADYQAFYTFDARFARRGRQLGLPLEPIGD